MSKLHFKGGPWANAEDAVLKAALAQYGLRDWERVASMLTKKTATQCRERWENYIDPRLNIREAWSLEEEEKLVELQSLFPNKFRLIAEQLTRRTPTHYIRPAWLCEQRYLELKDEQEHYIKQQQQQQQQGETAEAEKQTLEAFMAERRRRRNARKTHEERAARADTVSGELYEREMVSMATSRLANQDQKKGLRKERQRQLEEAAFLAKLESNREGIESGTLSLRQSRKMRKALEEDRQSTGLVDLVGEDDDDDDDEDDEEKGKETGRGHSDEEGPHDDFEAIDMYEDQQQAGLVKKQRVLMKNLSGQQRTIQQRQLAGGDGEGDEGDDDAEGNSRSRARAALTGVNQDLLKQLTAGPSTKSFAAAAPLLRDRPSLADSGASDAQAELKSSLADLFAALPQAASATTSGSSAMPPPLPLPPLKRARDALPPVADVDDAVGGAAPLTSSTAALTEGISDDLFGALNLPAPRKHAKTEATAHAAVHVTAVPKEEAQLHREEDDGALDAKEVVTGSRLASFSTEEEEDAYVRAARQWVEVECEKALTGATHEKEGEVHTSASPLTITPAEREAAERLINEERADGRRGNEESAAEALAAVQAYVADHPRYTARVNMQTALHQLSTRVAAQVQEANALLQPLRQEWEQVLSTAMLSPRELHVLQGYVRDDGQLKQPAAYVDDSEGSASSASSSSSSAVAVYVYEHLVNALTRARQAARFIASLREREQAKMHRSLDAAEFELQQLQAREKTLQDMYRQKRAQAE